MKPIVKKISGLKIIVTIISVFAIMIVSQIIGLGLGSLLSDIGLPVYISNVIAGILYLGLALFLVHLYVTYVLETTLGKIKVSKPKLTFKWILIGTAMPIIVTVIYIVLIPNNIVVTDQSVYDRLGVITNAVILYGIATGIMEEVLFRGVIMTVLEDKWNKKVAIFVPSVIFGAAHIIRNQLDFLSIIQLIIAGTAIGVVFSLITYETGSIWCSAYIHGIWNIIIIGGILSIGIHPEESHIVRVILKSESFLITGGDFGIESSIISLLVYLIVIGYVILHKKRNRNQ